MCCDQSSGAVMLIYCISCHKKWNTNSPTEAFEGLGVCFEHWSGVWEALFSARGLSLHLVERPLGWEDETVWRSYNSSAWIKDHCVRHLTAPIMPLCRNQTLLISLVCPLWAFSLSSRCESHRFWASFTWLWRWPHSYTISGLSLIWYELTQCHMSQSLLLVF